MLRSTLADVESSGTGARSRMDVDILGSVFEAMLGKGGTTRNNRFS